MAKMVLTEVCINKYKSYSAEQTVKIDEKITTLVGKNESGKTAFLEAIAKSNYFENDDNFKLDTTIDYPRKELSKYKKSQGNEYCIICKYKLGQEILDKIEEDLGKDVFTIREFEYRLNYDSDNSIIGITVNEEAYLSNLYEEFDVEDVEKKEYKDISSVKVFLDFTITEPKEGYTYKLTNLQNHIKTNIIAFSIEKWSSPLESHIYKKYIQPYIPKFWYYNEYYELPSRININNLNANKLVDELNPETIRTSKALFDMAGIKTEDILQAQSFEAFLADLEATSNSITDDIFEYWSTNSDNLEVKFEIETIPNNQKILDIRIRNNKHRVTLPLKNRSKGFNWFFSFIVWFSKIQSETDNYILLLDEPGLNLHASAQNDLLRFIEDLSANYQIVYTTHSPFMISSEKLDRVRTVFDTKDGTTISETIQEKDPDTLFPLQAALGYDIAQNLFISKYNLLVEGPADLLYLTTISSLLVSEGKTFLREDITIVPVGGLDKVTSFISLLRGTKLNIVCLLDSFMNSKGKQKLDDLVRNKIIKDNNIIFFDEFTDYSKSDIEDLFTKEEYLKLFNSSFSDFDEIKASDLENKPILNQINKKIGKDRFNHYLPSKQFISLGSQKDFLSEDTKKKFELIFKKVNEILK